jgi:hypothetical protein
MAEVSAGQGGILEVLQGDIPQRHIETGTNRGLRDCLFDRGWPGLHAGIPALERGPQVVVQGTAQVL